MSRSAAAGPCVLAGWHPELPLGMTMAAYDARLGIRLSEPVARRLRLLAMLRQQPLNRVLSDLLDEHLPSLAQLTEQLNGQVAHDQ